jgi:hypothetical protein
VKLKLKLKIPPGATVAQRQAPQSNGGTLRAREESTLRSAAQSNASHHIV